MAVPDSQGRRGLVGSNPSDTNVIANCCCHLVNRNVERFRLFWNYFGFVIVVIVCCSCRQSWRKLRIVTQTVNVGWRKHIALSCRTSWPNSAVSSTVLRLSTRPLYAGWKTSIIKRRCTSNNSEHTSPIALVISILIVFMSLWNIRKNSHSHRGNAQRYG